MNAPRLQTSQLRVNGTLATIICPNIRACASVNNKCDYESSTSLAIIFITNTVFTAVFGRKACTLERPRVQL